MAEYVENVSRNGIEKCIGLKSAEGLCGAVCRENCQRNSLEQILHNGEPLSIL